MSDAEDPLRAARLAKLEGLRELGIDPYPYAFARTDEASEIDRRYAGLAAGAETGEQVRVAGRIRAIRNGGMFIDLHDHLWQDPDFLPSRPSRSAEPGSGAIARYR